MKGFFNSFGAHSGCLLTALLEVLVVFFCAKCFVGMYFVRHVFCFAINFLGMCKIIFYLDGSRTRELFGFRVNLYLCNLTLGIFSMYPVIIRPDTVEFLTVN